MRNPCHRLRIRQTVHERLPWSVEYGVLIHKSQSWCEAGACNARITAPSALWTCFVTFDLPFLAGSTSFTQRSHSMDLRYQEEELGLQKGPRLGIGDGIPHEERHRKSCETKVERSRKKYAHNTMIWEQEITPWELGSWTVDLTAYKFPHRAHQAYVPSSELAQIT